MKSIVKREFESHIQTVTAVVNSMQDDVLKASLLAVKTLKSGNKILFCGNGGSAADAQHLAAELVGRYKTERKGLPGIALTTDTSIITAIGNDYGFERIFDRQIESLANKGDMLIGISTSGNSANVINALKVATELGCITVCFTGKGGGLMNKYCDLNLIVPSDNTARIQEMHILIGHTICDLIERNYIS